MRFSETILGRLPQSGRWFLAFLLTSLICLLVAGANAILSDLDPGSAWGMSYGVLATLLLLSAAAYSVRRRGARYPIGRVRDWLQFHVYGGTLFLLLLLMHSGFKLPAGKLAWSMWILSFWLVLSGLVGVVLQRWIPRLLTSGLSTEVLYERIPELVESIRTKAEKLVEGADETLGQFYQKQVAPALRASQPSWIFYIDITGGIQSRLKPFDYLRKISTGVERQKLDELEALYRAKLEIDAHHSLQKSLRLWLYGHIPVSILLMALVGFHIYSILRY